jgi:hypothetical protein
MLVLAMQFSRSFAFTQNAEGLGEVMTRCAGGPKERAARRPLLQNGIVMTAEPRLGLPTLEKRIEAPPS